jgi:hypothetical protein
VLNATQTCLALKLYQTDVGMHVQISHSIDHKRLQILRNLLQILLTPDHSRDLINYQSNCAFRYGENHHRDHVSCTYLSFDRLGWSHCSRVRSDILVNNTTGFFNILADNQPPGYRCGFRSRSTIPVLYVCRESYEVGSSIYTVGITG